MPPLVRGVAVITRVPHVEEEEVLFPSLYDLGTSKSKPLRLHSTSPITCNKSQLWNRSQTMNQDDKLPRRMAY